MTPIKSATMILVVMVAAVLTFPGLYGQSPMRYPAYHVQPLNDYYYDKLKVSPPYYHHTYPLNDYYYDKLQVSTPLYERSYPSEEYYYDQELEGYGR